MCFFLFKQKIANRQSHPLSTKSALGVIVMLLVSLSSCNVRQFLQKDQFIVRQNSIKIENAPSRRAKSALAIQLATLYKQRDLPDFFFRKSKSGAWYWFKSQRDTTPSRFNRLQYNNFSRHPSIFDEKLSAATVQNMKQYLRNSGYLHPSVFFDKNFVGGEKGFADVTYRVDAGRLFVVDSVEFVCADTAVLFLLNDTRDRSLFQRGAPLSVALYEQERQRITETLNNFGYAQFTSNYVTQLEADTSFVRFDNKNNRLFNLKITVQTPTAKPTHQKFTTGVVSVFPNFDARRGETTTHDSIADGKHFLTYDGELGLKMKPLTNAIPLTPGETYRKENTDKTLRQLTNLGVYRFVNIKPLIAESDSNRIDYKVYLTPTKKMSFEAGIEVNYSNVAQTSQSAGQGQLGRIGTAVDFGFTHRNLFGGAERFNTTLSAGLDYGLSQQANATNGFSSDIRFENSLSIPKFINPSGSWRLLNRFGIINNSFYNALRESASSDIGVGYLFSDRLALTPALYRLQQFNLNFRYVLKRKNAAERYVINQTGVELQLGKLDAAFEARINERFRRSLEDQLLTGALFRSLTYERNFNANIYGERWQFIGKIEQSGSELWLAERAFNKGDAYKLNDRIPFAKFWRGEVDWRFTRQFTPKKAFAARLSVGMAVPFGDEPVPYSRQFFVGGPNSVRGWLSRDLGPGGYRNFKDTSTVPYQAGDVKFEFNSEYRFPLVWIIESAIFLDAGNVWNLKKNDQTPDAELTKYWFDQVAISSGLGLRFNLTYFLVRVDFGFRLRQPYKVGDSNWIPLSSYSYKNNVNLNFALGLPF